ncbi:hypothetical protein KUCAC02_002917, partial [Chaenocephalus aceratus]
QPVSAKDKNYGRLDQSLEQEQQLLLDDQLREASRRGLPTETHRVFGRSLGRERTRGEHVSVCGVSSCRPGVCVHQLRESTCT